MSTTTQIKLTIPTELHEYLLSRTERFGLTTASYIKNLIINDVKSLDFPEYVPSAKLTEVYSQSLENEKQNNLIEVKDIEQYFKDL